MRYDNERCKGDHRHFDTIENCYSLRHAGHPVAQWNLLRYHADMPVATRDKVRALSRDLGSQRRVAALLGVHPSQVGRWIRRGGVDRDNAEKVDALEHVMASLLRLYEPDAAESWLVGLNPHLGARPIDLIRAGRTSELLRAIAAERGGSYA